MVKGVPEGGRHELSDISASEVGRERRNDLRL